MQLELEVETQHMYLSKTGVHLRGLVWGPLII